MKLYQRITLALTLFVFLAVPGAQQALAFSFSSNAPTVLVPRNGTVSVPISRIDDGKAHYFNVSADDGVIVTFFAVKSSDGTIRTAIDSCDVCYRSGKGYVQDGDFMVCTNCGLKFSTSRINEVKGGCNPAPLTRTINNDTLVIQMADINTNSWYCKFKN